VIEPRANPFFLGHFNSVAALYTAANSGRLHHGWLIGGPPGIGKATLAFRFARWLLAGGQASDLAVEPQNPVAHRVAAGTHPDLFTVERQLNDKGKLQTIINVETVRAVKHFVHLTASEGGWRAIIVDGAEDMNASAANALLKVLEEPPPKTILLLVTAAPGSLRPTILSRCQQLPLAALSETEVDRLLERYAPHLTPAARDRLVRLSEGSIGVALALAGSGGIAIADLVDEALAAPVTPGRAQSIAEIVTKAAEAGDHFDLFFGLLRRGIAATTRASARAGTVSLAPRVTLWQELGRMEREVQTLNLDKRAAVITALSQLHPG
jgi:DNA polymerase-3 subunit delta'